MILSTLSPEFVPFIQIVIALVFGMIIGFERVIAGRTAGPRTYGLVSMGACLAAILSTQAYRLYPNPVDPMPMMNAVITGIGFLGAGLIVLHGTKLSGLTTAAGVWVSAIIGIGVGFRMYALATFTTFLSLLVFSVIAWIERRVRVRFETQISQEGNTPEGE